MSTTVNDVSSTSPATGTTSTDSSSNLYGANTTTEQATQAYGTQPPGGIGAFQGEDLDALVMSVFLNRSEDLDNQVRNQVSQLEVNNTEMQNTNNATAALLAAGTGTGDNSTTFVYTNPTTGATSAMSVGTYIGQQTGTTPGSSEDQSDLETSLNDIGTQQQGMSQEQSTNISATMSKDNESWEGCTNLVSSISQSLSQIVGKW
jgi:hypothetical protein